MLENWHPRHKGSVLRRQWLHYEAPVLRENLPLVPVFSAQQPSMAIVGSNDADLVIGKLPSQLTGDGLKDVHAGAVRAFFVPLGVNELQHFVAVVDLLDGNLHDYREVRSIVATEPGYVGGIVPADFFARVFDRDHNLRTLRFADYEAEPFRNSFNLNPAGGLVNFEGFVRASCGRHCATHSIQKATNCVHCVHGTLLRGNRNLVCKCASRHIFILSCVEGQICAGKNILTCLSRQFLRKRFFQYIFYCFKRYCCW